MKPPRMPLTGSVLAVGLLVLLALATSLLFAGHETTVASYTGCLNLKGGTLVSVASGNVPLTSCGDNQIQVHLSGGDVTAVTAGTGLQGGATNGAASLSLAPSYRLPQECASGGVAKWNGTAWQCGTDFDTDPTAFGGFAEIDGDTESVANDPAIDPGIIGKIALPAGKYAIFAKVQISFDELDADIEQAVCTLLASDNDSDSEDEAFDRGARGSNDAGSNTYGMISLMLLHEFDTDGEAAVICHDFGHDFFLDQADAIWSNLRITAIRLSGFMNGTLPQ